MKEEWARKMGTYFEQGVSTQSTTTKSPFSVTQQTTEFIITNLPITEGTTQSTTTSTPLII